MKISSPAPRNKYKQILQIEGQPEQIFKPYEGRYFSIKGVVGGKEEVVSLGKIGFYKADRLKEMGLTVIETTKSDAKHVRVPGASAVRVTKGFTLIEVAGATEEEKNKKVKKITDYLARLGVTVQERCEWVCTFDPKREVKSEVAPAKITIGKQEIKLDTAPPALKEAINKQLREKPEGNGEKKSYPECAKCGHNGHITWCSQCHDGSKFEKGYRMPAKTKELQEMARKMGVK